IGDLPAAGLGELDGAPEVIAVHSADARGRGTILNAAPCNRDRPAPEGHRVKLVVLALKDAVIWQAHPECVVSYPVLARGPCLAQPLSQSALAALLPRGRPSDPSAAARPRRCAFGMIPPNNVPVVVGGGDLNKAVPELGSANILFGLLPRDVTLEHDVAVVRR